MTFYCLQHHSFRIHRHVLKPMEMVSWFHSAVNDTCSDRFSFEFWKAFSLKHHSQTWIDALKLHKLAIKLFSWTKKVCHFRIWRIWRRKVYSTIFEIRPVASYVDRCMLGWTETYTRRAYCKSRPQLLKTSRILIYSRSWIDSERSCITTSCSELVCQQAKGNPTTFKWRRNRAKRSNVKLTNGKQAVWGIVFANSLPLVKRN